MSAVPGLGPANLRLKGFDEPDSPAPPDITVSYSDDVPSDQPEIDEKGNILKIVHGDGSVTVSLDGNPISRAANDSTDPKEWFGNLAEQIVEQELNRITDDLLRSIQLDEDSRKDWLEQRAKGIDLLGLKLEVPGLAGASDGAPVEGMSKVRHPLLLEAVLRFQANASLRAVADRWPVQD